MILFRDGAFLVNDLVMGSHGAMALRMGLLPRELKNFVVGIDHRNCDLQGHRIRKTFASSKPERVRMKCLHQTAEQHESHELEVLAIEIFCF
jgi:hypothetical protein